MLDRQQLETFALVIELRGFAAAAKALHVTRGAISQRVIALEEELGTPLLVRDGNVPTPAGESVLRHVRALKLMEADTLQQVKPGVTGRTKVAVAVNADSLATWFEDVAFDIAKMNFVLELIVEDQDFTLPVLIRGEAIGCVSTENSAPTGFVADFIGSMSYDCVATQGFRDTHFPRGLILHDILGSPAVLFNRKDGIHAQFLEHLLGFTVTGYAAHYFPSPVALMNAVRAGVGYGLVPSMQAMPLVSAGELVALSPGNQIYIDLYWHHWKNAPQNAREISELIVRHAKSALVQLPSVPPDKHQK